MYLLWEVDRQRGGQESLRCLENLQVLRRVRTNLAFHSTLNRCNTHVWELLLLDAFTYYRTIFA
jgi:hypothetical protein